MGLFACRWVNTPDLHHWGTHRNDLQPLLFRLRCRLHAAHSGQQGPRCSSKQAVDDYTTSCFSVFKAPKEGRITSQLLDSEAYKYSSDEYETKSPKSFSGHRSAMLFLSKHSMFLDRLPQIHSNHILIFGPGAQVPRRRKSRNIFSRMPQDNSVSRLTACNGQLCWGTLL